ncbi:MAG: Maf family protein [Rickettsiales bacterium]|nr:Maf family protein [Rickettsiales bacterium]
MHAAPLILASASPRRLSLLAQVGIEPAKVVAADIDENPLADELPSPYVTRLAREKALHVAVLYPDAMILAADTTVALGRRILGKPEDEAQAESFLQLLSGRRHRVFTGICVCIEGQIRVRAVMTQVQFKRLSKAEVAQYLASGEWQGVAGGYRIQGLAERYIQAIHGSYSNVVGLPLMETCALMQR